MLLTVFRDLHTLIPLSSYSLLPLYSIYAYRSSLLSRVYSRAEEPWMEEFHLYSLIVYVR